MQLRRRFRIVTIYMFILIVMGVFWPGDEGNFWENYRSILMHPGVLISDFFEIGGIRASLINAGLVGLAAQLLIYKTGVATSGPTIAATFTLAGFALFGKTPLNIWPIFLGVYISAWICNQKFRSYLIFALFGTALAPLVTQVAFGIELGMFWGVAAGIVAGMALPALGPHLLHNHQGFNLYNIGFTCGVVGLTSLAFLGYLGHNPGLLSVWYSDPSQYWPVAIAFTVYFASFILLGWSGRRRVKGLWKLAGTLPTDFIINEGVYATLFNMGLVGLMGMGYVFAVGGDFNGPVLGGVFTMVGFAAFGKHVKNCWPLMLGVFLGTAIAGIDPSSPGPLLAALFGTTLAPIAGGFGPIVGIIAGVVHLVMVSHVGSFHGGLNLYNNGFAGGLVGTLFIGVSRWYKYKLDKD